MRHNRRSVEGAVKHILSENKLDKNTPLPKLLNAAILKIFSEQLEQTAVSFKTNFAIYLIRKAYLDLQNKGQFDFGEDDWGFE